MVMRMSIHKARDWEGEARVHLSTIINIDAGETSWKPREKTKHYTRSEIEKWSREGEWGEWWRRKAESMRSRQSNGG